MGYQLPISPDTITIAGHTVPLGGSQNLAASDLTNGTTGSGEVVLQSAVRTLASATVNLYVATTGNDSNSGLSSSSPFLTLQHAVDVALSYDSGGQIINIYLANGTTYQGFVCSGSPVGQAGAINVPPYFNIIGSNGSSNVTIADTTENPCAIVGNHGVAFGIQGVTITSENGGALFPCFGAHIYVNSDVKVGLTKLGSLHSETSGVIELGSGITFTGSGTVPALLQCRNGGAIIFDEVDQTVTISGDYTFANGDGTLYTGFADIEDPGSQVYANSNYITFSVTGSVTGPRYYIAGGAGIVTISGTNSYFPGSEPGTLFNEGTFTPPTTPTLGTPTGLGTGGSVSLNSGSSDLGGYIQVTTGTGSPAASGTIPMTFGSALGQNFSICNCVAAGGWPAASTFAVGAVSTTGLTINWYTNGSALATSSTYYIGYSCKGL